MESKLRDMIKSRGMKASEVARKSGISGRYIRFMLQGVRSPSLKVAMRMAQVLDCNVEDIFLPIEGTKRGAHSA